MGTLDYRPAVSERRPLRLTGFDLLIATAFLLLSWLSLWVAFRGASDEPYAGPIRMSDGIIQVGAGSVLIVAWIGFTALVAALVFMRRTFLLWLIAPFWGLALCFHLGFGVYGYMADLQRYHQPVWPASP